MTLAHAPLGPSTVQVTNDTALPANRSRTPLGEAGTAIPCGDPRVDERTLACVVAAWLDGGDFAPIGDRLRDLKAQYNLALGARDNDALALVRTEIKAAWSALDHVEGRP
jgi:hypothetical protein